MHQLFTAVNRPVTNLDNKGGEEFSEMGSNLFNYTQYFYTLSNTIFQVE